MAMVMTIRRYSSKYPATPDRCRSATCRHAERRAPAAHWRRGEFLDQPILEGAGFGPADGRRRADAPPRLARIDDLRERLEQPALHQFLAEKLRRPDRDTGSFHGRLDRDHGRVEGQDPL